MPSDSRRIQGPEDSYSYLQILKLNKEDAVQSTLHHIKEHKARKDGRALGEHRKIYIKTGMVSQAKGSAYIELNNTKVVCSVFDPREIPNRIEYNQHGELYCMLKFAPFSCPIRRSHLQDSEEKELSLNLKRALEPAVCRHEFPNFQVDIYVLVLENDGCALSAAITCAGLALADAHVPMYDLVTAATLCVSGNLLLMDPLEEEEGLGKMSIEDSEDHGIVTLTTMGAHSQVSQVWQSGSMSVSCLNEAVSKLVQVCQEIYPFVQCCLVKSVTSAISRKDDSKCEAIDS